MMQPIPDGSSASGTALSATRPSRLRVLSASDHDLFTRAFAAADHGDWVGARALAAQGQSPIARRLLEWRYALDKNSGASFAEIDAVTKDTEARTSAGTWPLRGTLQARGEAAITPDMAPATVIAWFGAKSPNSSIGKIRLGEALVATGEKTRGAALIRAGWAEGNFYPAIELAIVQKDAAALTPDSDRARLDGLLWRGDVSAAKRELSRVDAATAAIADARIALYSTGLPKAQAALDKVADSSDPGLLFDWARLPLRMLPDRTMITGPRPCCLRILAAGPLLKAHVDLRWWDGNQRAGPGCAGQRRSRKRSIWCSMRASRPAITSDRASSSSWPASSLCAFLKA